ncbi:anhydro-N-acetylmuramic acid kinase [Pelagibacterales bacterium SAG-MED31]|nr:anhydro-N-acetylmuramic acid kinase [Pelagibacterales bacterium SAG-MED31]
MKKKKNYNVIGVMTGTSMDGIDISYCFTDGLNKIKVLQEKGYIYSISTQNFIKKIKLNNLSNKIITEKYDKKITEILIYYLKKFLKEFNIHKEKIDFISLSGQTIIHMPKKKFTLQLGSPTLISKYFKLNVISDFRIKDILNGGQGAPIGSYYHKLLIKKINPKSAIINLGGVANFSLINKNKLISSDIGPANAINDDLMYHFFKKKFDRNGTLASEGMKNFKITELYKKNSFFKKKFPKSLDRNNFYYLFKKLKKLKPSDALSTSNNFTIYSIIKLIDHKICKNINEIIFTGGGRKNKYLLRSVINLKKNIKFSIIDDYKFNGDLLEAQMFAYIGVRSLKKLILSTESTTGVKKSTSGGKLYKFNY